ncbi:glycoside hydrolase family 76 protein [Aspergillus ibericus CBS 121593]|uniref:Mannan endo-1,6-alpha-mannosidase n=1 Tax=Aspergillus ibericus CBS 121593 TaxID=1448316 RepID=A0A395H3I8_9EURO|nr:glycosyl hydrolase [Aspergillus ibericus CBS 121593]RAL02471.1 glycosyl hydrolase [Aspergillus ibericus CBS 121593]
MISPGWIWAVVLTILVPFQGTVPALQLDINDEQSIKNAARTTAYNMMSYYHGNESGQTPGKLPDTWWEGGAMFMTLIQYWYWTGDTSYNEVTTQGMLWQKGQNDYFPANDSNYLGNDDQVFWGLAAMTAAELNYPEDDGQPSWLSLAQGVFNTQVPRWDTSSCQGGLRWQIWPYQAGYTTKNAISNGGLFQLAARLGRYTNNETYSNWAEKIWDWSATTPLLQTNAWYIADTTTTEAQCKDHGDIQWTYNYGTYISGAAYMYNLTNGADKWKKGLDGLLGSAFQKFFPQQYGSNVMSEISCEPNMMCDRNQDCFKGFLASWLTFTTTIAPYTAGEIIPKIQQSALAAAKQCSGGDSGTQCGRRWYQPQWDGETSLETDMSALSVFSSNMITHQQHGSSQGPLTSDTGGTSKSDPNAGTAPKNSPDKLPDITTGDRAGASVLTVAFVSGWVASIAWLVYGG